MSPVDSSTVQSESRERSRTPQRCADAKAAPQCPDAKAAPSPQASKAEKVEKAESSTIFAGAVNPSEVLGGDAQGFATLMQSMSSHSSSVFCDFGRADDGDGPPMLASIAAEVKSRWSCQAELPKQSSMNLSLLLAVKNDRNLSSHCQGCHAICVLTGTMSVSATADVSQSKVTLQKGDLMVSQSEQWYATSDEAPCLAMLFTSETPQLSSELKQLAKISLAKVSQLAKNGGGDWQKDANGNTIDWSADGALANGEVVGKAPEAMDVAIYPPVITHGAFDPEKVLNTSGSSFRESIRTLSTQLPIQVHFEPETITANGSSGLVRRAVDSVVKLDAVKELFDNSGSDNVRLKMRISGGGKFIHRNRYPRRQAFALLAGEMTWLLVESQNNGGAADEYLGAVQNDNWNGYRCPPYPKMLSLSEMEEMKAKLPSNVETRMIHMKAGDVLVFDGRWWHATNYNTPAMSMFLTPGKDMEVAVKEQERRRKMPKQSKLKICTFYDA